MLEFLPWVRLCPRGRRIQNPIKCGSFPQKREQVYKPVNKYTNNYNIKQYQCHRKGSNIVAGLEMERKAYIIYQP